MPPSELLKLPVAGGQFVASRLFGYRPELPWWPLNVIPHIERHLTETSSVIEFGSGLSTIWLARRARAVLAIEDNQAWHAEVTARIAKAALSNVSVRYLSGRDYYTVPGLESGPQFDLAVIDGSYRWKCVEFVLPLMRPGSIVYLDNSDADKDRVYYEDASQRHLAQKLMLDYTARTPGASIQRVRSFIMSELHAGEGMILTL